MSLHHGLRSPRAGLAGLTLAVVFALACRDGDPSGPPPDPLAGLTEAQRGDTDTAPSPEPGGNHEPGQIVGTIGG